MTKREQTVWLGLFTTTLNGVREMGPAEAAKTADAGLDEFRARAHPRRSLWDRLFGRARKPTMPVYVLHVEAAEEPGESGKPERWFRTVNESGRPRLQGFGTLEVARSDALGGRAAGVCVSIQMTADLGVTWVDVGDDGEPLPPQKPHVDPECAFVPESPEQVTSPPPPPADAA